MDTEQDERRRMAVIEAFTAMLERDMQHFKMLVRLLTREERDMLRVTCNIAEHEVRYVQHMIDHPTWDIGRD
jgi:hypothetical protein